MYKDKDKQREANRQAMRRKRAKGITEKVSQGGITDHNTDSVTAEGSGCDGQGVTVPDKLRFNNGNPSPPSEPRDATPRDTGTKRGKDIKCFADLSPSIQQAIDRISDSPEEKRRRTGIAIDYQHKHPDRYHSTGAVFTGKMTVMERLFYRPGQRNFVSLPGRACHGVC